MSYAGKRQSLYNLVLERTSGLEMISEREIRIITDKLMVKEFNGTFYSNDNFNHNVLTTRPFDISLKVKFSNLVKVTAVTLYAISQIVIDFAQQKSHPPDCLIFGLPEEIIKGHTSNRDLKDFVNAQLVLLDGIPAVNILIQSRTLRGFYSSEGVNYVRDISTRLLQFSNERKIKLAYRILRNYAKWLTAITSNPEIILIGKECIIDSVLEEYAPSKHVKSIVTTQSTMLCLPSAMSGYSEAIKIMFWYSDNSQQIKPVDVYLEDEIDYTYLELDTIDVHFVWTESWASILRQRNRGKVIVIGPILFKNLELYTRKVTRRSDRLNCLVFDVTPKTALSNTRNFYKDENVMGFVSDILETLESLPIKISIDLKPKRPYSKLDSRRYIEFLAANSHRLKLLPPVQDIPLLIGKYDLVICIPYTSPGIVAKKLGVDTLYYSPTSEFRLEEIYEGIPVIVGREALLNKTAQM